MFTLCLHSKTKIINAEKKKPSDTFIFFASDVTHKS